MTAKTPFRPDCRPTPDDLANEYFMVGEKVGGAIVWDLRDEKYLTQALKENRQNVLAVYKFHLKTPGFPVELVSLGPHMLNKYELGLAPTAGP